MNDNGDGFWGLIGVFGIVVFWLAFMPLKGLSLILDESGGIVSKILGWMMLIAGVTLWIGVLQSTAN